MTTLGEFHSLVASEANKGNRLDAIIPAAVRRAALWFERNYSFTYMDRYVSFTLDPTQGQEDESRIAPLDGTIKAIGFVKRLDDTDKTRLYDLNRVSAQDVDKIEVGPPTQYWLDGHQWLWFNRQPDKIYTFHMSYVGYTKWPTDLNSEQWLISYGEDALLAKTLMMIAPGQREPEWLTLYAAMYSEGLQSMLSADAELKYHNVRAYMHYKPDFVDDPRLG